MNAYELSAPAWARPTHNRNTLEQQRVIRARVGATASARLSSAPASSYPRPRGRDHAGRGAQEKVVELSVSAWARGDVRTLFRALAGVIRARAGATLAGRPWHPQSTSYPRLRGRDAHCPLNRPNWYELSAPAWARLFVK